MNLNKLRAVLPLILLCVSSAVFGATFYVDTDNGNDANNGRFVYDPGTYMFPNGPKLTITAALAVIADGDIIEITGGNYPECIVVTKTVSFSLVDDISIKCFIMNGAGKRAIIIGGRDLIVLDSISLRNGIIDASGSTSNLVAGVKCQVTGGSKTSFVDNKLYRVNSNLSVSAFYFPVGTGSDYRPVNIDFKQNNTQQNRYAVQLYSVPAPAGSLPPGIKNISKVHYWYFRYGSQSVPSSVKYSLRYDSTKNDDEVFDPKKLRLLSFQPQLGKYLDMGGTGSAKYLGTITATSTTDTPGIFTIANIIGGVNTLGRKEPVASFGWIGKCVNVPVQFRDSSFTNKSTIVKWTWDFGVSGNADTAFLANPKFTYTSTGPFSVRLIVRNSLGLSDTLVRQLTLKNGPNAYFGEGDACLGTPINFKDSSTVDAPDTITSRLWRLGDGSQRTLKNFNYLYSIPGKYTVSLVVNSSSGCLDTLIKDINIFKKPGPNFTVNAICRFDSTEFKGTGGNAGDSIVSWDWITNNSKFGSGKQTKYRFPTAGNKDITLAVTSQTGCTDTIKRAVVIYELPVASYYLDPNVTGNDSIQCFRGNRFDFYNNSFAAQGQIMTATWLWGTPPVVGSSVSSRKTPGTFPVKLLIVTNRGCKDSIEKSYRVRDSIRLNFGIASYCLPKPAEFSDSSSFPSGTITARNWTFGDGGTGTGTNTTHAYASGGVFQVKLKITNSEGCSDSLIKPVNITPKPTINLIAGLNNPMCHGDSFEVTANGGSYVKWSDDSTNRRRFFKTAGTYRVTAYTSPFCFETDSVTLVLNPPVFPDAGLDTFLIRGRYITLKGDGGLRYEWLPRSEVESPDSVRTRVKPQATTTYYLIVTDGNGCKGIDSVTVFVREPEFIRIPNMITPNGDGKNDAWDLREVPNIDQARITIYTSVGEKVWQTDNGYDHNWVGTDLTGYPLPMGDYLYVIEIPTEKEPFRGVLHIAF